MPHGGVVTLKCYVVCTCCWLGWLGMPRILVSYELMIECGIRLDFTRQGRHRKLMRGDM